MPRVTMTAVEALGPYATDGPNLPMVAATPGAGNGQQVAFPGREIIIARNCGAVARQVTITSTADSRNRTGNIVDSLAAGETHFYGPFTSHEGWRQAVGGWLFFEADHAEVLFGVIRLRQ